MTLPSSPGRSSPLVMPLIDVAVALQDYPVSRALALLADTGADDTCLHLRDALRLLGVHRMGSLAGPTTTKLGVGGGQQYYQERAWVAFQHHDGALETYELNLSIVVPYWNDLDRLAQQFRLPSILGWDLLQHFRTVFDYRRHELSLDST